MKTSGTKYNLNVNKNITFGNYQGANCAYGNSANYYSWMRYTGSTQIIPNANFTRSCRIYLISTSTDNPRLCSSLGGNPYGVLINNSGKIVCWTTSSTNGFSMITGARHMYTVVGSFTNGTYKGYIDGELVYEWSGGGYNNGTGLSIAGHDNQGGASRTSDKLNGYFGRRILENVQKDVNRIKDLFKKTKKYYGY